MERRAEHLRERERDVTVPGAAPAPPAALGALLDSGSLLSLQRSAGNAAVGSLLPHAEADGSLQRALARSAGRRTEPETPEASRPAFRSPALLLRSKLRKARLQRVVSTSGGDWDTDQYELKQDDDGEGPAPASENWRGADITLKFKPNAMVDAELIGLTQTVQTVGNGAPALLPSAALRPITAGDAEPINTGAGETDEGTAIDQSETNTNPIYAVDGDASTSLDDASDPFFGENGWRYTDATQTLKEQSASLIDTPRRPGADKNFRHIFETTALATKGAQAGTYYGSVRWGWRTDAAGAFTKIDLAKVSDGVPSSTFLKAGAIWNATTTADGKDTVDLPLPDVQVTTAAVTLKPPVPMVDIALPIGTRLQVVRQPAGPMLDGAVKVVDGPHTGITGDVDSAEWANIADERA